MLTLWICFMTKKRFPINSRCIWKEAKKKERTTFTCSSQSLELPGGKVSKIEWEYPGAALGNRLRGCVKDTKATGQGLASFISSEPCKAKMKPKLWDHLRFTIVFYPFDLCFHPKSQHLDRVNNQLCYSIRNSVAQTIASFAEHRRSYELTRFPGPGKPCWPGP